MCMIELQPAINDGYFSVEVTCSSANLNMQWRKNKKWGDSLAFAQSFCAVLYVVCEDDGNEVVSS